MILKLKDIYLFNLGKFMFSYVNNMLPRNFNNSILRVNQVHGYNLRSSGLLYVPFCRTKLRQFSVIYQGPTFFNALCSDIRNASTFPLFVSKLKNFVYVFFYFSINKIMCLLTSNLCLTFVFVPLVLLINYCVAN